MKKFIYLCIILLFSSGQLFAQKTITGTITDEKGAPVPNVSVVVKGTTVGTTTKSDGSYSLSIPSGAKQLEVTSTGFASQTLNIGPKNSYSLSLTSSSKSLDEVVITGINRVKKSEFTGATTKIDSKLLNDKPVGSFDQLIQGRVPGVMALTSSGAPGSSSTIIIRGTGSINGDSDPLYILDGIQIEKNVFQSLNANDFASVDVLRDASATALYGSRGSAGIIVLTSKRGTASKMKLGYNVQVGRKAKPEFAFKSMNTAQLLKAQEDYGLIVGSGADNLPGYFYSKLNPRYAGLTPGAQASEALVYDSLSKINTDWSNQIFKEGNFSNHQLTLSGGSGKTRIYSSLDLYNEDGTTLRSDQKRITFRNNVDYADDKFTLSLSSNLGYTKRNFQQSSDFNTSNPFTSSALVAPYAKVRNANGTFATGTGTKYIGANQLDLTSFDENSSVQLKATISTTMSYKITNQLTAALTAGIDFRETQGSNYGSPLAYNRKSSTSITGKSGFQNETFDRFLTGNVRPSVSYRNVFAEKHDVEVTVLGEFVKEVDKNFSFIGYGVDPKRPNTIAAITQGNAVNQYYAVIGGISSQPTPKYQNTLLSGLAIARYTYNEKYTISGSYRNDGSSKLPTATRWQGFYSVGGIWDIAKENFIKGSSVISALRLRGSYGSSGNSNNFPGFSYPYQATYTQGNYSGLNTIYSNYAGNPALKWEKTNVANIGIDFELLKGRIYGDVNVYDKRTVDLFVQQPLSATAGYGNGAFVNINSGKLQNKGIEWNINVEVIRSKKLVWTIFSNGAYNRNRVLDLGNQKSFEQGTELIAVGKPIGSHYQPEWAGVDAATGAGLYVTATGSLTTDINNAPYVQKFGTWEAPWKGGFGTTFRYGGFDLSALFSWQRGGNKFDNLQYFLENPAGFLASGYNQSAALNFWKKPGDIATTPSPLYGVNFSSEMIHDASFMRLRDVTLGYNLSKNTVEKMKFISAARFFVQGTNLFLWTKWRGRDPEAGATNLNISEYPNPRAITAGLNVTF